MGPIKTPFALSFGGGIDTKTDPKQVLPTKLLSLQNGIFKNAGAIAKRWGYSALGTGILGTALSISSCFALHAFNEELLLYDGASAYSYSPSRNGWINRGGVISVIQTNQQIVRNSSQQISPDFATSGGIEVYAYEDSGGGIRYSVVDAATGTLLVINQPLYADIPAGAARPKCIAFANLVYIFFVSGSQLLYVTVNPQSPTAVTSLPNVLLNGLSSPAYYDASVSGSQLMLAYYTPTSVNLSAFASSQIAWTATVATQASVPTGCLNVTGDASGNAWISYADSGAGSQTCSSAVYASGGALVHAPVRIATMAAQLASLAGIVGSSGLTLYVEVTGSQTYNQFVVSNTMTSAGVLGNAAASVPVFRRSVGLASKPFAYGTATYVNVAFQSNLQPTYFTLDASGNVVAKVNAGLGGGLVSSSDFLLPECPQLAAGIFKYPNLVKGAVNTQGGAVVALLGVNATKLDFIDSNHFISAAINGGFYTVGGVLQSYDGAQYVEHGFNVYPEPIGVVGSGTGGNLGTGTYFYVVTYEWTDNNGLTQVSTPSVSVSVSFGSGSTNSATITVPTLRLTKKANVRIVIYRTAANGVTLTRVTSAIAPLYNNPAVDTVSFVDTASDASIAGSSALYTQPLVTLGNPILANSAPPACTLAATYADRLWLGGIDDPYTLWYSKQSVQGLPMEFSSLLMLRIDPDGGGISALARMDEKFVIFKTNAIFYLIGQGPTATGDQNDFQDPIQIPSGGVGCVNERTVVLTPAGLMFSSGSGIYLLDRNLNVSYLGAPVEAFTLPTSSTYAGTITSATLLPNQWVLFTTASGTALVYDYLVGQWATFTNHAAVDSDVYLGQSGLFVWANAAGQVFEQTPSAFSDNGAAIPLSLTTAWINPGVIQGYQRVYHAFVLGTYKGTHTLNVWVGTDYRDQFTQLAAIPSDPTLGIGAFGSSSPFGSDPVFGQSTTDPDQAVYAFRVDILQKCSAIRLQISDQQSAPGNEGFSLSAVTLVLGIKPRVGNKNIASGKQFGAS